MVIVRDISYMKKIKKQEEKLKVIDRVTQSVTHNIVTPLRSMSLLALNLGEKVKNNSNKKDIELIYSTSQLVLTEVKTLLDKNQLDANRFLPYFVEKPINQFIDDILVIFKL